MKSSACSSFLKAALLIVQLTLGFGSPTVAKTGDRHPLFPGAVRPGYVDYRTESAQGYLKVYSATDEYNDGGLAYYSHSSYAIYTTDGKLFKRVENHVSPTDESPDLVALPDGRYLVIARSEDHGDVGIRVSIKEGRLTVLDLDRGEKETKRRRQQAVIARASSRLS